MSVDASSTGLSQLYSIQAARSGEVPLFGCPQVPQPWPVPGEELRGVDGSLTMEWFSHDAVPLVRIDAEAPNSADISTSVSVTSTSRSVRSSPSEAQNRRT